MSRELIMRDPRPFRSDTSQTRDAVGQFRILFNLISYLQSAHLCALTSGDSLLYAVDVPLRVRVSESAYFTWGYPREGDPTPS